MVRNILKVVVVIAGLSVSCHEADDAPTGDSHSEAGIYVFVGVGDMWNLKPSESAEFSSKDRRAPTHGAGYQIDKTFGVEITYKMKHYTTELFEVPGGYGPFDVLANEDGNALGKTEARRLDTAVVMKVPLIESSNVEALGRLGVSRLEYEHKIVVPTGSRDPLRMSDNESEWNALVSIGLKINDKDSRVAWLRKMSSVISVTKYFTDQKGFDRSLDLTTQWRF